jgi:hypothetical protein
VDELGRKQLLLNFGNVEYLSSPVLGIIATLNKKVKAAGGRLITCNLDPQISELLKRSDLAGDEDDPDEGLGGVISRLKPPKLSPAGQAIVFAGALLGLVVACAVIFLVPVNGIIPGILLVMGGPALGIAIARPLALAITKRKG